MPGSTTDRPGGHRLWPPTGRGHPADRVTDHLTDHLTGHVTGPGRRPRPPGGHHGR
ncbi:hypothetical protein ACFQ0M_27465 [Kitasatospora aburaviensis]